MPYITFAELVNLLYIFPLMSACCNLRPCSPLKTVFNKLGDTYQAFCNTYKTHAMATHHRGAGQPLDRTLPHMGRILIFQMITIMRTCTTLETWNRRTIPLWRPHTQDLNDLQHRLETGEGQPTEAINCMEHEFYKLCLVLHSSAPPEPLDDVLQQYTETLCSAQKHATFVNTLTQDIPTFNGSDSTQLED